MAEADEALLPETIQDQTGNSMVNSANFIVQLCKAKL